MTIAILGRQPALGLAELESIGANVRPLGLHAATFDGDINPARLGSVMRLAQPLDDLPSTDWPAIVAHIKRALPGIITAMPEGKIKLGMSIFGLRIQPNQLFAAGLDLKKTARAQQRSLRIIPNNSPELNSAQVLHNGLTGELGIELLIIQNGRRIQLARTTWVQDVDTYAARDYGRPMRDAFVGMLPPKLAQTMLNLAQVQPNEHVLDPFCGTGVVLQEASLLGCPVYGTDLQERMVRYTRDNIQWLHDKFDVQTEVFFEVADATNATWRPPLDHVVCETYLGQPLSGLPKPEKLAEIMQDCNVIVSKFLANIRPQLATKSRHTIAVPAWRVGNSFRHLNVLDHLEDLGYNRVRFQHARESELIYHREGQIVARELLVLTVK